MILTDKRPPRSARCHPARAPASRLPDAPSPVDPHDSRGRSLALSPRSPRREGECEEQHPAPCTPQNPHPGVFQGAGCGHGGGVSAAAAPYLVQALPAGPGGGGHQWPCRLARGWVSPAGRSRRRRGRKRGGEERRGGGREGFVSASRPPSAPARAVRLPQHSEGADRRGRGRRLRDPGSHHPLPWYRPPPSPRGVRRRRLP
ncbi:translation initiation factor IF-2-like [Pteropus medius]|uniref:translation initiation factor IF-2-like n=1 Tax=Pteropus vampyrus TaxID=132908 RepID=UPI00196ADD50|nr:translation initiation factor IF-2-like [Pteropus giganteus]XP_039730325.1 translation initiation factor IF-2-like [Pteropus giganteus]XP_039730326.1 translation initiation factor IF-2-like [Pteropus giganteus]XP_039730327.1 translation initiation factor IF-2-like [Pteropus giganteus]XP_039730328.1 translation initiation factor IF-2-like [Pteropus giganteus]XP_039730329.1 translation initiation factor IF-2-like [Pteropus giganteus]